MSDFMQWVEERSWRDPENDCLVWKLGGNHGGKQPQGRYLGKIVLVRRVLWLERHSRELRLNETVRPVCGCERCVEPSHLVAKRNLGRIGQKATPAQKARIANGIRASRQAKLTAEAVEDIRSRQQSRREYAQKYGIAKEYVSDLQGHRAWRDYTNPFLALARWSPT